MRAHGWWHSEADAVFADDFGWGRRAGPLFASQLLASTSASPTYSWAVHARALLPTPMPSELDALMSGLLIVAALSNRTLVLPDVACPFTSDERETWFRV